MKLIMFFSLMSYCLVGICFASFTENELIDKTRKLLEIAEQKTTKENYRFVKELEILNSSVKNQFNFTYENRSNVRDPYYARINDNLIYKKQKNEIKINFFVIVDDIFNLPIENAAQIIVHELCHLTMPKSSEEFCTRLELGIMYFNEITPLFNGYTKDLFGYYPNAEVFSYFKIDDITDLVMYNLRGCVLMSDKKCEAALIEYLKKKQIPEETYLYEQDVFGNSVVKLREMISRI
jgi:hypothetical protein